MNLNHFDKLDPNLLPGLFNTALRNEFDDLEDLLRTHDLEREPVEEKMRQLGYEYNAELNQFRAG